MKRDFNVNFLQLPSRRKKIKHHTILSIPFWAIRLFAFHVPICSICQLFHSKAKKFGFRTYVTIANLFHLMEVGGLSRSVFVTSEHSGACQSSSRSFVRSTSGPRCLAQLHAAAQTEKAAGLESRAQPQADATGAGSGGSGGGGSPRADRGSARLTNSTGTGFHPTDFEPTSSSTFGLTNTFNGDNHSSNHGGNVGNGCNGPSVNHEGQSVDYGSGHAQPHAHAQRHGHIAQTLSYMPQEHMPQEHMLEEQRGRQRSGQREGTRGDEQDKQDKHKRLENEERSERQGRLEGRMLKAPPVLTGSSRCSTLILRHFLPACRPEAVASILSEACSVHPATAESLHLLLATQPCCRRLLLLQGANSRHTAAELAAKLSSVFGPVKRIAKPYHHSTAEIARGHSVRRNKSQKHSTNKDKGKGREKEKEKESPVNGCGEGLSDSFRNRGFARELLLGVDCSPAESSGTPFDETSSVAPPISATPATCNSKGEGCAGGGNGGKGGDIRPLADCGSETHKDGPVGNTVGQSSQSSRTLPPPPPPPAPLATAMDTAAYEVTSIPVGEDGGVGEREELVTARDGSMRGGSFRGEGDAGGAGSRSIGWQSGAGRQGGRSKVVGRGTSDPYLHVAVEFQSVSGAMAALGASPAIGAAKTSQGPRYPFVLAAYGNAAVLWNQLMNSARHRRLTGSSHANVSGHAGQTQSGHCRAGSRPPPFHFKSRVRSRASTLVTAGTDGGVSTAGGMSTAEGMSAVGGLSHVNSFGRTPSVGVDMAAMTETAPRLEPAAISTPLCSPALHRTANVEHGRNQSVDADMDLDLGDREVESRKAERDERGEREEGGPGGIDGDERSSALIDLWQRSARRRGGERVTRLEVSNLSVSIDSAALRTAFAHYGEIRRISFSRDFDKALISFVHSEDALRAAQQTQRLIDGQLVFTSLLHAPRRRPPYRSTRSRDFGTWDPITRAPNTDRTRDHHSYQSRQSHQSHRSHRSHPSSRQCHHSRHSRHSGQSAQLTEENGWPEQTDFTRNTEQMETPHFSGETDAGDASAMAESAMQDQSGVCMAEISSSAQNKCRATHDINSTIAERETSAPLILSLQMSNS